MAEAAPEMRLNWYLVHDQCRQPGRHSDGEDVRIQNVVQLDRISGAGIVDGEMFDPG